MAVAIGQIQPANAALEERGSCHAHGQSKDRVRHCHEDAVTRIQAESRPFGLGETQADSTPKRSVSATVAAIKAR